MKTVDGVWVRWQSPSMQEPQSILIYTDGEVMGDGIIRLPLMAALRARFPHASITRLVGGTSVYDTVLHELAHPYFDEVVKAPLMPLSLRDFLFGPRLLRSQRFDVVIDTQRNLRRSLWLKRIAHGRFISAAAGYMLSDARPATRTISKRMIDQVLELVALGIGEQIPLAPLQLTDPVWAHAANSCLPSGSTYIGFVVGAGHPGKCWPLDRYIALAKHCSSLGYVPVVFLGPNEKDSVLPLQAALPDAIFPLQMSVACDISNPCFTIALAQRLTVAVANDSGGGHLLAAGGCAMLSLFRSASVRAKFMPASALAIALAPEDFGGVTIDNIPEHAVREALQQLLNRASKTSVIQ